MMKAIKLGDLERGLFRLTVDIDNGILHPPSAGYHAWPEIEEMVNAEFVRAAIKKTHQK